MTLGRELRIRPEGAVMEKFPLFANESKGGCGGCGSGACGTCAPALDKPRSTAITRRRLAQTTIFGTAAAVLTGCSEQTSERKEVVARNPSTPADRGSLEPAPSTSPDLAVVQQSKGPIVTAIDEFFKMGPGPSSSHTMGPMRITYDFYQRIAKLPDEQLRRATALKVHLFGSLSATGKGHGTDRAALAGLLGKAPATCPPEFLDSLATRPDEVHALKLGPKTLNVSLKDVVFDDTKGKYPHANTMRCKLFAGNETIHELEYYSVGGGFIEWKGYKPPDKGRPKYTYGTMKELMKHVVDNKIPLPRVLLENEMAITGKSEKQVWDFIDQVTNVMMTMVNTGLKAEGVLPGPIKLHSKAATVFQRAQKNSYETDRAIGMMAAAALAASEENARGHIIVTAPTGGSAGVIPALTAGLRDYRKVSPQALRDGFLAAAAIGYLCKHNATLSAAEGGCQAEIGVASSMGAAMAAQAEGAGIQVVANAAESALEHHLGMTCDPVAGFVQVPCIERCAFGAVKAWTAYAIASNEIEARHRVDLDTCINAMAMTARDMNKKYKETSEAGLAALVLC
jgi:L-serine dehydratase